MEIETARSGSALEAVPITVLLVEDDLDVRDTIQDLLEANGYDIVPASNGLQALDYLDQAPQPSLVLLDLMLPLIDGWRVLEVVRQTPRLAQTPIVVFSAATRETPPGADEFLRKPVSIENLLDAVHRHCGLRHKMEPPAATGRLA